MKLIVHPTRNFVDRRSMTSMLVEDLRERILNGDMPGGMPLRQEAIAAEYEISRMPVREALRQLDAEGLVQVHSRGAQVAELSIAEVHEIFAMREFLEVGALRRAIPRMTRANLDDMRIALDELTAAYAEHSTRKWGLLNTQFHLSIYEPCAWPTFLDVIRRINYRTDRYLRLQLALEHTLIDEGYDEHKALLDLCAQGNVEDAATLLGQHIRKTKTHLTDLLTRKKLIAASD